MGKLIDTIRKIVWNCGVFYIMMLLVSCTKTEYVSVPEYHYVNTNSIDTIRDSIFHDVLHTVYIKGDTVFDTKKEIVYKDRLKCVYRDSVVRDSVRVPYPIERKLSKWERLSIDWFGYAVGILLLVISLFVIYIIRRVRR